MSRSLFNEMNEGMFPVIMTAPTPLLLVVLAHLVTEVIIWIPITVGVLAAVAIMFRASLSITTMLSFIALISILVLAYIGVGLFLNAIVTLRPYLRFLVDTFNLMTLLLSGAFFPLEALPGELLAASFIIPVKHAIDVARDLVFIGRVRLESVLWLLSLTALYNIIGAVSWLRALDVRRRGETWV